MKNLNRNQNKKEALLRTTSHDALRLNSAQSVFAMIWPATKLDDSA